MLALLLPPRRRSLQSIASTMLASRRIANKLRDTTYSQLKIAHHYDTSDEKSGACSVITLHDELRAPFHSSKAPLNSKRTKRARNYLFFDGEVD
ncbi:unnamed protein product [Cylicocyclus nassatus]|uniref:Uncharacterized protein n=1 Tax=Cylicocyclus nassatus TaxID=53992 RepID=A0AA36HDE2_CYLNA|nr:unnamed protein product [Cylicocyclus nassatus]